MRDKKLHIEPTPENFRRYFGNQMTGRERNAFERMLEKDPFAAEAAAGFEKLGVSELEMDLAELQRLLNKSKGGRRRWIYYSSAAAVISLLIVSTFFLRLEKPEKVSVSEQVMNEELNEKSSKGQMGFDEKKDSVSVVRREGDKGKNTEKKSEEKAKSDVQPDIELSFPEEEQVTEKDIQCMSAESVQDTKYTVKRIEEDMLAAKEEIIKPEEEKIAAPTAGSRSKASAFDTGGQVQTTTLYSSNKELPDAYYISGRVISAQDDEPLPGVNIIERSTTNGTVTDANGFFSLKISSNDKKPVLTAQFIGMDAEEVAVQPGDTTVNITMEPSLLALDEVVVVGYGSGAESDKEDEPASYYPAEPVGGRPAFNNYIEANMLFPEEPPEILKGVVILKFTVSSAGRPVDIEIIKSPGAAFSNEAIRLLENGPDWQQPKLGDEIIERRQRLRLVFKKPPGQ